jgi:hypothetical protein
MTVYYDPKNRKPKIWVPAVFIIIPLILFMIIYLVGKGKLASENQSPTKKSKEDIFDRF